MWSASVGSRQGFTATNSTKPGRLRRRLPERGVALQGRIGRLQVLVRHDAEHVVGGVVALLHPGIDVVAALDLPFVDVRGVAERLELLGDPERPVAVAARIADEDIGHATHPRIGRAQVGGRHDPARPCRARHLVAWIC